MMMKFIPVAALIAVGLSFSCAKDTGSPAQPGEPGIEAIIRASSVNNAVLLGEVHANMEFHGFLDELLRDPQFLDSIDDIAVEFGNSFHQTLVDRYVRGEDVTIEELAPVWRDTTQWLVWDSPVYQSFFETVRAVNAERPDHRKVRVLLLDPPIDWSAVSSPEDYAPYADRDGYAAQYLKQESLERGRKSLTIMGGMHVLSLQPNNGFAKPDNPAEKSLAWYIKEAAPDRTLTIWPLVGPGYLESLGLPPAPKGTFYRSDSPELSAQSFSNARLNQRLMIQKDIDGEKVWTDVPNDSWPAISDMVDALLFISETKTNVSPGKQIYLDQKYQSELRRRAKILEAYYGFEFESELDAALAE